MLDYGESTERTLTDLPVGQFFGLMGMLEGDPRSATAVIVDEGTTLERIALEDIRKLFETNPSTVWMILEHIALRLRHLTDSYAKVCREIVDKSAS